MIENTSNRDPFTHLIGALGGGPSGYIEQMEADGCRQLATSDLLPTDMSPADESAWTALGFVFGDVVKDDPLFRHATLPAGWTRQCGEDPRGQYLVDERGIRRVSIFYKAAFHDRRASMHIANVGRSVAADAIYGDGKPAIRWDVLTADEKASALAEIDDYIAQAAEYPDIYRNRLPRAKALKVAAR